MQIARNKAVASIIALFLTLTIAVSLTAINLANAQTVNIWPPWKDVKRFRRVLSP